MPSAVSRRTFLGAGLGLLAAGVAGCSSEVSGTGAGSPAGTATLSADPLGSTSAAAATSGRPATSSSAAGPTTADSIVVPSATAQAQGLTTAAGPAGSAVEVGTGPTGSAMVALTFHGGGDPATATSILDICAQRGAHVTVLAIGTWLQDNPTMASAILSGGHDLDNHTWSHSVLSDLDRDAVRVEIIRCRDLLQQLTGSPGAFFRTSSGQHASQMILDEAGAAGYPVCLSYDVDPQDWTDPGAAAARSGAAAAAAGSIVSLHFGHPGTVQALPGILDDLAARGLQAVSASTLLAS